MRQKIKTMKIKLLIVGLIPMVFSTAYIIKYSSGIAGYTGSSGESTCTSCHGGGSGTTNVSVSFNPAMPTGSYTPGQTYTVSVTISNSAYSLFGFGCEILNSSNTNCGSMTTAGTGVKFLTASNGRKNAVHSTPKSGSGAATFTFVWMAPMSGTAYIHAVGNAVNGNGGTSGDKVSSAYTMSLTPDVTSVAINNTNHIQATVYPNPVKDVMNIQLNLSNDTEQLNVFLFDLDGKKVYSQNIQGMVAGIHSLNISIPDHLTNGLYTLCLNSGNSKITKLILIEK